MAEDIRSAVCAGNPPDERYLIPVLCSAFRVIEELSGGGSLTLNDLAQRTRISKSTVFRILRTLTHLGYVKRAGNRSYSLSFMFRELVDGDNSAETLRRVALPEMLALRDQFHETVNLGRLELDKVMYIEVVPSEYALRLHERPGAFVPLHSSALGKAILAFSDPEFAAGLIRGRELERYTDATITDPDQFLEELKRVRRQGYAMDRGETHPWANCIAAPILDASGVALAAISISGPSSRFQPRKDSPVVESLIAATSRISHQLTSRSG